MRRANQSLSSEPGSNSRRCEQEDKNQIESAGREFAEAQLKKQGYAVEQMRPDNPGYDIEARKEGEVLRIEVKAHRQKSSAVVLTETEWQAYLESKRDGSPHHWQLWNVENLSQDACAVVSITSYDNIPEEALRSVQYRVDLRLCSGSSIEID